MNANGFAVPVGAPPDCRNHGAFVPISPSNGGGSHPVLPKPTSTSNRKRAADPSDLQLEHKRERLRQTQDIVHAAREQDREECQQDKTAYENALHDLIMALFRIAKAKQSFPLMHECLSFTLRFGLESDLERYHFCTFYATSRGRFHRDLSKEQMDDLKLGILPFTIERGTSIDDLVAVYIDIAEWKLHPCVSFLLTLLLVMIQQKNNRRIATLKVQDFLSTDQGANLMPISTVLFELVQGDSEFRERREEQLQRLITIIDLRNPMILPALIHSGPLRQTKHSPSASSEVKEARKLIQFFERDFENTDGAREILVARFGRWPYLIDPTGDENENTTDYRGTPDSAAYAAQD
mmetsp:Transcript_27785/g.50335  ORF Transcript_27785/g.50335 Transcript_27785/m.50335 type:complete len:351 (+) Transcript_27785:489-1541(+)